MESNNLPEGMIKWAFKTEGQPWDRDYYPIYSESFPNPSNKKEEGLRFDEGKLRVDLIPPEAVEAMAEVLAMGAKKYEERNWEKGMKWSKVYAPLYRHLLKFWKGEDLDDESKLNHMKHVLWNAMALVTYIERKIGTDDRPTNNRT